MKMTFEEEEQLKDFYDAINKCLIKPIQDDSGYIWSDYKAMSDCIKKLKGKVNIYTIVTGDEETAWVLEGYKYINRVGYILTSEKISIPEDGIRYW